MFDEILQLVKEHLGNNPEVAAAIPADQQDAVHNEIANNVTNSLTTQPAGNSGMFGDIMSKLESGVSSGSPMTSAIEGGLVISLASKFGLPPAIDGAIAGAIPGLF